MFWGGQSIVRHAVHDRPLLKRTVLGPLYIVGIIILKQENNLNSFFGIGMIYLVSQGSWAKPGNLFNSIVAKIL